MLLRAMGLYGRSVHRSNPAGGSGPTSFAAARHVRAAVAHSGDGSGAGRDPRLIRSQPCLGTSRRWQNAVPVPGNHQQPEEPFRDCSPRCSRVAGLSDSTPVAVRELKLGCRINAQRGGCIHSRAATLCFKALRLTRIFKQGSEHLVLSFADVAYQYPIPAHTG